MGQIHLYISIFMQFFLFRILSQQFDVNEIVNRFRNSLTEKRHHIL